MPVITKPIDIIASEGSTDYDFDCMLGRELAARLIRETHAAASPISLVAAMRSVAESGRWSGVEIGFAFTLAGEFC